MSDPAPDRRPVGGSRWAWPQRCRRRFPLLWRCVLLLQHMHWTEAFTSKLSDSVKLVGSQISCEGVPAAGDARGPWRRNPRVLPWAWATDAAGWEALTGGEVGAAIFACHASPWDVRYLSDAGASLAIMSKVGGCVGVVVVVWLVVRRRNFVQSSTRLTAWRALWSM